MSGFEKIESNIKDPPLNRVCVTPNIVQHCADQCSNTVHADTGQYTVDQSKVLTVNISQSEVSSDSMPRVLNVHLSSIDSFDQQTSADILKLEQ